VVDVGKTIGKISLWTRDGCLLDRQTRINDTPTVDGIARLDAVGIGGWLIDALSRYRSEPVELIVPVAHGAGVAAIRNGTLAYLPFDYEAELPDDVAGSYAIGRPNFAETGSPALPAGLNLAAQLHWAEHRNAQAHDEAVLVPWAQYWAWFLSGRTASEVSSLGCHSDLWAPGDGTYSTLARQRGWADRLAPLAQAGDTIGTLRPDLAERCGLPVSTKILTGLHDSNAALLAARGIPQLAGQDVTVLSTGTWFIAMRTLAAAAIAPALPDGRDCLVNVDILGKPVPSARWMGGREIAMALGDVVQGIDDPVSQLAQLAASGSIAAQGAMMLPTLAPGCGPFPDHEGKWHDRPAESAACRAATCLYAALMSDAALNLVGSTANLLIEGRFAGADVFTRALASLRPDTRVFTVESENDVSFGALRLALPSLQSGTRPRGIAPLDADLHGYRTLWHRRMEDAA